MHTRSAIASLLLRAFPRRFRDRFGEGLRVSFEAAWVEHRARGLMPLGTFLVRTTADMLRAGLEERLVPTLPGLAPRRLSGLPCSLVDVRLGLRMLRRYPGSTAVAVFALAVGIPVGLAPAHLASAIEGSVPGPEGDRVRVLRYWNTASRRPESLSAFEYARWRDALSTFDAIGASRSTQFNLETSSGDARPVAGAEVTASMFDVFGERPLLGRTLAPADQAPGAPPVVVIGHRLWQSRFGGMPGIVGQSVRLGDERHTIVGVMPASFGPGPELLWKALEDAPVVAPGRGLPLVVVGRLAEGSTAARAEAELGTIHRDLSAAYPESHARLSPEVLPIAYSMLGLPRGGLWSMPEFYAIQALTLVLLTVACTNVGLLIFARTATRAGEFAVRTALGASRARIVVQVFTESLVLAGLAAALGLAVIDGLLRYALSVTIAGSGIALPAWFQIGVTPTTVLRAVGLAVFSATVAGVVPALRMTGRAVHRNIQVARSRTSGVRFGGLSSALVVADVAVAVVVVGLAVPIAGKIRQTAMATDAVGIPAGEYLAVHVRLPERIGTARGGADESAFLSRASVLQESLVAALKMEPGVRGVAVGSALPRMDHEIRLIELDVEVDGDRPAPVVPIDRVRTARVAPDFFEALEQPILMGRGFTAADLGADRSAVIVNTTFVEQVLGGRQPLGRRLRYRPWGSGEPGPWFEIVGVVGPLGMHVLTPEGDHGVYHAATPGEIQPMWLGLHVAGTPSALAPRVRTLVSAIDPEAIVGGAAPLDTFFEGDWYLIVSIAAGGVLLVGILVTLAASGLYAILSFTVAARTREIGIRVALGASRGRIVFILARRALLQVALGVLLGTPVAARFFHQLQGEAGMNLSGGGAVALALVPGTAILILISVAACTAPMRRALRISPTEALRGE